MKSLPHSIFVHSDYFFIVFQNSTKVLNYSHSAMFWMAWKPLYPLHERYTKMLKPRLFGDQLSGKIHLGWTFPHSSVGKESDCKCRRPWFDSWVGKICWRRDRPSTPIFLGFPCGLARKESACNMGDLDLIPGWEDSPEKEKATHSSRVNSPWPGEFHGL